MALVNQSFKQMNYTWTNKIIDGNNRQMENTTLANTDKHTDKQKLKNKK